MIVLAISKEKDMELSSFRNFKEVFDKCYEIKDFVKKDIYKWQISDFSSDDSELDEFDFHQKKYADFLGYCRSVIQKKEIIEKKKDYQQEKVWKFSLVIMKHLLKIANTIWIQSAKNLLTVVVDYANIDLIIMQEITLRENNVKLKLQMSLITKSDMS